MLTDLQAAIVGRLRNDAAVTAIVPAADIFDRSSRPERPIYVVIGEDQIVREGATLADRHWRTFTTMHLWHRAQDFATLKNLTDAIRAAVREPFTLPDARVVRLTFEGARFLRDPGGEYLHAVVTIEALIEEPVQ